MEQKFDRQTAQIIGIQDILTGDYVKEEGWQPNYIVVGARKVSRVNIIGTIVDKGENQTSVDDGNASISLRSFENPDFFKSIEIGDTVVVVGKPRQFNDEKYIAIEILKKTDPGWLKVRQKQLEIMPEPEAPVTTKTEEVIVEEVVVVDQEDKLIQKIRELDQGQGIETQKLLNEGFSEQDINRLLENGEIFEISPGKLKILE